MITLNIVTFKENDPQVRLALASVLMQHGGTSFDVQSRSRTISSLIEGLEAPFVMEHVHNLCSSIGKATGIVVAVTEEDGEEVPSEVSVASAALEALVSLARNSKISNRHNVCKAAIGVLIRLSLFADLNLHSSKKEKKQKKSKSSKKDKDESNVGDEFLEISAVVKLVEGTSTGFAVSLVSSASSKLLGLLADLGSNTLEKLADKSDAVITDISTDNPTLSGETLLQWALRFTSSCSQSGLTVRRVNAESEGDEDSSETILKSALDTERSLTASLKLYSSVVAQRRFIDSLRLLLSHAIFHIFSSEDVSFEVTFVVVAISFLNKVFRSCWTWLKCPLCLFKLQLTNLQ